MFLIEYNDNFYNWDINYIKKDIISKTKITWQSIKQKKLLKLLTIYNITQYNIYKKKMQ